MATSPLPSRGSPMPIKGRKSEMARKWAKWLHHPCLLRAPQCPARGENQNWPTSGHNGYITPALSGLPNAQQGEEIRNAHKWGQWLHYPCLLGDPQCRARGKNQKDLIRRHSGYITPAFSGLPNAQQGTNITNGPQVGTVATSPLPYSGSPMPSKGRKSEMAHKWAQCLHHPCLLGAPQCRAQRKNINRRDVGTVATSPLPSRGSPMPSTGEKSERSHKQA